MRTYTVNCSGSRVRRAFFLAGALAIAAFSAGAADEYTQITGVIHLDSKISGGDNSPEMIAAAAKNAGAEFAILTDHDTQKVSYGFPPFRDILKVTYGRPSVRSFGVPEYLAEVERVNSITKNFLFLPGIEAVPYYAWSRDNHGALVLGHLHRHILVCGLDRADDIGGLPSVEAGYPERFTRTSLLGLVWILPFLIAVFVLTLPERPDDRWEGGMLHGRTMRFLAWMMAIVSVLALANAYPFTEREVDPYPPDHGSAPYQSLIDYVDRRGGMTFWAHPEAEYRVSLAERAHPAAQFLLAMFTGGNLTLETRPYPSLLTETRNYTGFAIFNEGARIVGQPEGIWDDLLMQFCTGMRPKPVWAVAELDLEEGTSPDVLAETRTVLLVREKTRKECLDALRLGRIYCFTAFMDKYLTIREYAVISGNIRAISGDVLTGGPDARLVLDLGRSGEPSALDVVVVRDGTVFTRLQNTASGRMEIPLPATEHEIGYVRVLFYRGADMVAATNPIFIARGKDE